MSFDQDIEKQIQAKGLSAPRLTPEAIAAVIVGETYTVLPSGKCMVCELTLTNGFTVRGEASAVSKENFDEEIGKQVSRRKAVDQIWPLEGYLLQQRLYERHTR
ncbi:Gp49 family protein [Bradyrhizobium sp. PMVTL-01]|uniref:Gp49 family protein n=1 Tax=Bradyrhizobium sp. PMVTL-01 TaxID=3434999 RepID=UPI003F709087